MNGSLNAWVYRTKKLRWMDKWRDIFMEKEDKPVDTVLDR